MGQGKISHLVNRSQFWEDELVIAKHKDKLHWPAKVVKVDHEIALNERRYSVRHFVTGETEFLAKKKLYPYKENRAIREAYQDLFDFVKAWEQIEERFVSEFPELAVCSNEVDVARGGTTTKDGTRRTCGRDDDLCEHPLSPANSDNYWNPRLGPGDSTSTFQHSAMSDEYWNPERPPQCHDPHLECKMVCSNDNVNQATSTSGIEMCPQTDSRKRRSEYLRKKCHGYTSSMDFIRHREEEDY